jgi:mycoredoxin
MNRRIRMYTTTSCGDCHRAKRFLRERQLSYEEIDIEADPVAADFVSLANDRKFKVPTFDVNGRTFHCSPYDPEKLARELGL